MTPKRIALGISLIVAGLNIAGCTRAGSQAEISPGASTELISSFPDEWFFYEAERPAQLRAMEGNAAPMLATAQWIGQAQDQASLRGNVVVVDFWATWCGPCIRAIPHNVEIVKQYADEGVVLIGVHDARRGWDKAAETVDTKNINYPVALDMSAEGEDAESSSGVSTIAWNVRFWPTYFVIDKQGRVRAAGLKPDHVENVIDALLAE
ncbi:MAG: TlpA disulfide reductase family protein [Planctomycetota bacterium]|nr:TlpA disulfide reductase family protein [Planctomycetota bacterium]